MEFTLAEAERIDLAKKSVAEMLSVSSPRWPQGARGPVGSPMLPWWLCCSDILECGKVM